MIKLISAGHYKLIETKHNTKVLYLDDEVFAWVEPVAIGEILVHSHKHHDLDCILSIGEYKLLDVTDEPTLSDQLHLELQVGSHDWQGYLLPTGLPNDNKIKSRVIPTRELITNNHNFKIIPING